MSDVQKAIDRASGLPIDLEESPVFTEINSEEFPVLELAITGSNENRARDKFAEQLKEDIEDIKSIKSVRLSGDTLRTFRINLDRKKLRESHISVGEVLNKIASRNKNTPGGTLKTDRLQELVRIEGKVKSTQDLKRLVLRSNFSGKTIYLQDVAEVIDGKNEVSVLSKYNGEDSTLLIVTKKAGVDTISMVKEISKKLDPSK